MICVFAAEFLLALILLLLSQKVYGSYSCLAQNMEGRAGWCQIFLFKMLFKLRSGVDFTVVRDSVILLERKPLPRLHLTTGATALLECKVAKLC